MLSEAQCDGQVHEALSARLTKIAVVCSMRFMCWIWVTHRTGKTRPCHCYDTHNILARPSNMGVKGSTSHMSHLINLVTPAQTIAGCWRYNQAGVLGAEAWQ
jgi:hypothetical protein